MKRQLFFLIFAIILSAAAVFCSVNIVIGIIYTTKPNTTEILAYYNSLANIILCIATFTDAIIGLLISVILIIKNEYKTISIITLSACIVSCIPALAAFLM